jgi:hypothetical protein
LDLSDAESKWNQASCELLDLKVAGLIGIAFNYQELQCNFLLLHSSLNRRAAFPVEKRATFIPRSQIEEAKRPSSSPSRSRYIQSKKLNIYLHSPHPHLNFGLPASQITHKQVQSPFIFYSSASFIFQNLSRLSNDLPQDLLSPVLPPLDHRPPLRHLPPNTSSFSFLASINADSTSIGTYDHACVEIGHNPSIPSPNHNLKKPLVFGSQLKWVINVYFTKWYLPPSIGYKRSQYGWGSRKVNCSDGGHATDQPWYRCAGYFEFVC